MCIFFKRHDVFLLVCMSLPKDLSDIEYIDILSEYKDKLTG